jgi:cytochrome c-type biogenesis protein CcmH/NrfF
MTRFRPTRLVAVLAMAALAVFALAPATQAETRASLPDIEDEVMCTICGTLLAESQSPQADRERALIRTMIAQGKDKDQIKDALVAEYGANVLATPSGHGFDLLAWLVPGIVIAAALCAIALMLSRQRQSRIDRPSPPDLASSDLARLERDMSSHDL